MQNQLNFNYHDAVLESIQFQQNTLVLTISLYSIFYPTQTQVKLILENISNHITCEKWIAEVNTAYQEENEDTLDARINAIYLNENHHNQLLISIDSIKTVKLNFIRVSEIVKEK